MSLFQTPVSNAALFIMLATDEARLRPASMPLCRLDSILDIKPIDNLPFGGLSTALSRVQALANLDLGTVQATETELQYLRLVKNTIEDRNDLRVVLKALEIIYERPRKFPDRMCALCKDTSARSFVQEIVRLASDKLNLSNEPVGKFEAMNMPGQLPRGGNSFYPNPFSPAGTSFASVIARVDDLMEEIVKINVHAYNASPDDLSALEDVKNRLAALADLSRQYFPATRAFKFTPFMAPNSKHWGHRKTQITHKASTSTVDPGTETPKAPSTPTTPKMPWEMGRGKSSQMRGM